MIYLTLIALATFIYAGAWMFAAPSKALLIVNKVAPEPVPQSRLILVAFRYLGLALILLSILRLPEIA